MASLSLEASYETEERCRVGYNYVKKSQWEGCYIERYQDKVWGSHNNIAYAHFQMLLLNF